MTDQEEEGREREGEKPREKMSLRETRNQSRNGREKKGRSRKVDGQEGKKKRKKTKHGRKKRAENDRKSEEIRNNGRIYYVGNERRTTGRKKERKTEIKCSKGTGGKKGKRKE